MTDKRKTQLPVRVGPARVGEIGRSATTPTGSSYRYEKDVSDEQAISLVMPIRWQSYEWPDSVHPLFQMHMPEGLLREQLLLMFSKTVPFFDDIDLLGIVGPHQLGRVTVGNVDDDRLPDTSVEELLVHDSARGLFEDLMHRYARYSGVSGQQPKVLIRDEVSVDLDRITHRGATHLVKSWRAEDHPELAANEYFCMRAAAYSGLEVPKISLSANGKFLIVERFDVSADGYLGFEDMCALSGLPSSAKYNGSYEGCAKLISAFVSSDLIKDSLESLFLAVALSTGVKNGDFHLKQLGVLYPHCGEDAEVRLSPAYDIVSTTPYRSEDIMAMFLAGSKGWPKHHRLVDFGRRSCQLSEGRCRDLLEQVTDGMANARVELVNYLHNQDSFLKVGTRMLAAWENGTARSLLADDRAKHVDMGAFKHKGPGL